MSETDNALKPILVTLLKLLEVSELQALQEQNNHTAQLKAIESALTHGQKIDIPKTLSTFSDIITTVTNNTASLIQVNNELVKTHKEQKDNIDKLIMAFETYASRMDVLALATQHQSNGSGIGHIFEQLEVANASR